MADETARAASDACQEPGHYVVDGSVCLDCRDVRSIVRTDPCEACGKPTPIDRLAETITSTAPDGSVAFARWWVCPTCLDVILDA